MYDEVRSRVGRVQGFLCKPCNGHFVARRNKVTLWSGPPFSANWIPWKPKRNSPNLLISCRRCSGTLCSAATPHLSLSSDASSSWCHSTQCKIAPLPQNSVLLNQALNHRLLVPTHPAS